MIEIKQGEKAIWGYGYCWRNYDRDTITTFLVPFNFLLRWGRELYFWLAKPRDYLEHKAYTKGYSDGMETGFRQGKNEAMLSDINILKALFNKE